MTVSFSSKKNTRPTYSQPDQFSAGPSWKGNLFAFGLLILMVLGYFFWQAGQTQKGFLLRASQHSRMLAGILAFNANNAVTSQQSIEETTESLSNLADYVIHRTF